MITKYLLIFMKVVYKQLRKIYLILQIVFWGYLYYMDMIGICDLSRQGETDLDISVINSR